MTARILVGDCRELLPTLEAGSVHACVTSPPYFGLRDYGVSGQMGMEPTPAEYIAGMVAVFREVRRVLRSDGTCWIVIGDSYASDMKGSGGLTKKQTRNAGSFFESRRFNHGLKAKDLMMIPARLAIALQSDGWYLRSDIIWNKPNPMPESVTDRPTSAHEHVFLLTKRASYWYDADAVREQAGAYVARTKARARNVGGRTDGYTSLIGNAATPDGGRNLRDVWTIATHGFAGSHFATFPPALVEPCIKAGCPVGGTVLDPFSGSGTTGVVAARLDRNYIGIELNADYAEMSRKRITNDAPMFAAVEVLA